MAVKTLNGIGGINQPPDFLRKLEIGAQIGPVVLPGGRNLLVFLVPPLGKYLQCFQCSSIVHSCIYRFQVCDQCLQILVGNVPGGIANLVNDTVLDFRFGEICRIIFSISASFMQK